MAVPDHVRTAFQVEGRGEPAPPAWPGGTRFGRVVVVPAAASASWSGHVRERLAGKVPGLRVSRPVRATDGRLAVGGFSATEFATGAPAGRIDEAIAASLRLDEALVGTAPPPAGAADAAAVVEADREVWADRSIAGDGVVAHLDFLRSLLFHGTLPPTLSRITPSSGIRPRGYTAALTLVDGLLCSAVDDQVLDRWRHVPGFDGLVVTALEARELAAGDQLSNLRSNFRRVASIVSG